MSIPAQPEPSKPADDEPEELPSYGTPDQFAKLLDGIKHNAQGERDATYGDPGVQQAAESLGTYLLGRVREARDATRVRTSSKTYTVPAAAAPTIPTEHQTAAHGFLGLFKHRY